VTKTAQNILNLCYKNLQHRLNMSNWQKELWLTC